MKLLNILRNMFIITIIVARPKYDRVYLIPRFWGRITFMDLKRKELKGQTFKKIIIDEVV